MLAGHIRQRLQVPDDDVETVEIGAGAEVRDGVGGEDLIERGVVVLVDEDGEEMKDMLDGRYVPGAGVERGEGPGEGEGRIEEEGEEKLREGHDGRGNSRWDIGRETISVSDAEVGDERDGSNECKGRSTDALKTY